MKTAVLFCLVLLVICDQVLCYFINVTRDDQDKFTFSNGHSVNTENSYQLSQYGDDGCRWKCEYGYSTFLNRSCVSNLELRNKSPSDGWVYLLPSNYGAGNPIKLVDLAARKGKIDFKIKTNYGENVTSCIADYMERQRNGMWQIVNTKLLERSVDVLNGTDPSMHPLRLLFLKEAKKWQKCNVGSVVRIRIQCVIERKNRDHSYSKDDYLVFKIPGTIKVNVPEPSSATLKSISSLASLDYPNHNVSATATAHSHLLSPSAITYPTNTGPHEQSRSTPVLTVITMQTNEPQSIKPSTTFKVMSSVYSSVSQTVSLSISSTAQTQSCTAVPTASSMSSVPARNDAMLSDGTHVGGIVGGALGGLVILVFAVLVMASCLKKRRLFKSSLKSGTAGQGGKDSSLIYENPGQVPLPTLSNPVFQEGSYENPEDVHFEDKKQSGVNSIESAAYDRFLIVENPYARDEIAKSVYDNVPEEQYKALDLMKRDPSAKYQSLLKPGSEYTTVADSTPSSGLLQEPVYSVVDDKAGVPAPSSSPNGQPNEGAGVTEEPVYNVLDIDDTNIPEQAAEPVYNILKQSTKSEGAREPVYSVLEDEALERNV